MSPLLFLFLFFTLVFAGDEKCIIKGGTCKYTTQCKGKSIPGLCSGISTRQCCFSSNKNEFFDTNQCHIQGGKCMLKTLCILGKGKTKAGLCPGSSSIQCCFPPSSQQKDMRCANLGGECKDVSLCTTGKPTPGKCPGATNIQCCIPKLYTEYDMRCPNMGGVCMHKSKCTGTPMKGLCPGDVNNQCCLPMSSQPPPIPKTTPDQIPPSGTTCDTIPQPKGCYTTSSMEVVTTKTTPTSRQVVDAVKKAWGNDLKENGARVFAAQWAGETGAGAFCYNYNLGNVKTSDPSVLHMYLRGVWEVFPTPEAAQKQVDAAGGLATLATPDEIKKKGWPGSNIVIFHPPHAACRFKAYTSLDNGAVAWITKHQKYATDNTDYLPAANRGDTTAIAKYLKQKGYYTAPEASYAAIMASQKARIDAELGAIPSEQQ